MKKLMMFAALAFAAAGCQTRITAEKNPEQVLPIQSLVMVDGSPQLITTGYERASGGWRATARSPLYASEGLRGLDLGVQTNGTVYLRIDSYDRDVSSNAVAMVRTIFDGSAGLAAAIGKAYATIATGGSSDAVSAVAAKAYNLFKSRGGNEGKSTVAVEGDALKISDGEVCIECDAAGNCTDCTP